MKLGIKIKELRDKKSLSQQELSKKLHISVNNIKKIEKGTINPDRKIVKKLSKILNYDFEEQLFKNKIKERKKVFMIMIIILLIVLISIVLLKHITVKPENKENISKNNTKIEEFNDKYETEEGIKYGIVVSQLIEEIINNNKTNKQNIIKVNYKNIKTSNQRELNKIKNTFEKWNKYEITVKYNKNKYINEIIIKDYNN